MTGRTILPVPRKSYKRKDHTRREDEFSLEGEGWGGGRKWRGGGRGEVESAPNREDRRQDRPKRIRAGV